MKEYKVVTPNLGWKNKMQILEDILNDYARDGWSVKEINIVNRYIIVFERNKNR